MPFVDLSSPGDNKPIQGNNQSNNNNGTNLSQSQAIPSQATDNTTADNSSDNNNPALSIPGMMNPNQAKNTNDEKSNSPQLDNSKGNNTNQVVETKGPALENNKEFNTQQTSPNNVINETVDSQMINNASNNSNSFDSQPSIQSNQPLASQQQSTITNANSNTPPNDASTPINQQMDIQQSNQNEDNHSQPINQINSVDQQFTSTNSNISNANIQTESNQIVQDNSAQFQANQQVPPKSQQKNTIPGTNSLPPLDSIIGDSSNSTLKENKSPTQSYQTLQSNTKPPTGNLGNIGSSFDFATASMEDFMTMTINNKASDLHLGAEDKVFIRVDGGLRPVGGNELTNERAQELIFSMMSDEMITRFEKDLEIDFSYAHPSGNRFRVNVFYKEGTISSALRLIPNKVKTISELNLPDILYDFTKVPNGIVLVTGPTGSGKSTSIAAMIQEINISRAEHILTIEDPIEYVFPKRKSLVEQRELGKDTLSWKGALKSALRQDPNIVLVGEMRDYETIESAITVAETGHLVFATLHTNSASQTMDRIIDVFPEGQQSQIRTQLANVIVAVVAQRLIPVNGGGREAVFEIMTGNAAVRNAIRENKTYQIDNIIQTNVEEGMMTLESSLAKLVKSGRVSVDVAKRYTSKPQEFLKLVNS